MLLSRHPAMPQQQAISSAHKTNEQQQQQLQKLKQENCSEENIESNWNKVFSQ